MGLIAAACYRNRGGALDVGRSYLVAGPVLERVAAIYRAPTGHISTNDLIDYFQMTFDEDLHPSNVAALWFAYMSSLGGTRRICLACPSTDPNDFPLKDCIRQNGLCSKCWHRGVPKWVSQKVCVECGVLTDDYRGDREQRDGRRSVCAPCENSTVKPPRAPLPDATILGFDCNQRLKNYKRAR